MQKVYYGNIIFDKSNLIIGTKKIRQKFLGTEKSGESFGTKINSGDKISCNQTPCACRMGFYDLTWLGFRAIQSVRFTANCLNIGLQLLLNWFRLRLCLEKKGGELTGQARPGQAGPADQVDSQNF